MSKKIDHRLYCEDVSLTKQSFKDECDINNIMNKWVKNGILTHVSRYQGRYEDLSGAQDYHTSLNQVIAAQEAFETLPATIRSRFQNDPGEFLSFVSDPANLNEMKELGLIPSDVVTEAVKPADLSKSTDCGEGG